MILKRRLKNKFILLSTINLIFIFLFLALFQPNMANYYLMIPLTFQCFILGYVFDRKIKESKSLIKYFYTFTFISFIAIQILSSSVNIKKNYQSNNFLTLCELTKRVVPVEDVIIAPMEFAFCYGYKKNKIIDDIELGFYSERPKWIKLNFRSENKILTSSGFSKEKLDYFNNLQENFKLLYIDKNYRFVEVRYLSLRILQTI